MEKAKKLLAEWHLDKASGCRCRFIDSDTERQILHCHDFYEVFLVLGDGAVHVINGEEKPLCRGFLSLVRPDDCHFFRFTRRTEMVNIAFSQKTAFALSAFFSGGFSFDDPFSLVLTGDEADLLAEKIRALPGEGSYDHAVRVRLLLAEIFARGITPKKDDSVPGWLYAALEKMREKENFSEGIPALVRLSGKSYEHALRSVKKHLGVTASDFINSVRINYAENMIINSNLSVSDICYDSGFSNLSWFYSEFKKHSGMTPGEFRKKFG